MSNTFFINQPFNNQSAGEYLTKQLEDPSCVELKMAVAFAKTSGVNRLKKSMDAFRARGGKVTACVGIDLAGTTYEALSNLNCFVDDLYVIHLEGDQTFHPKLYNLIFSDKTIALVGSHNLTRGGLWTNVESCSVTTLVKSDDLDVAAQAQIDAYFEQLTAGNGFSKAIKTQDDIDELRDSGYVPTQLESYKAIRQDRSSNAPRRENKKLFSRKLPTNAPVVKDSTRHSAKAKKPTDSVNVVEKSTKQGALLTGDLQTFWFQSGQLTGGSRNQLDLSMKALVKSGNPEGTEFAVEEADMMKGGLYFFGLDSTTAKREGNAVTILCDGKDFENNEIKLYAGNNANGTWRLNLKGVTSDGESLLDHLGDRYPDSHHPLQNKVLAFEFVSNAYYALTIFEESDLKGFEDASALVGWNGANKNARLVGVY